MYKMLVLDIDGTLLNSEHKITKENIEAIQEAANMGVKVVLASGRVYNGMLPYLNQLGLVNEENYSVSCSGAIAVNNTLSQIIASNVLNINDLRYIYDVSQNFGLSLNVYTADSILAFSEDDIFTRLDCIANNVPFKVVDFNSIDENIEILKITVIRDDLEGINEIEKFFKDVQIDGVNFKDIKSKMQQKRLDDNVLEQIYLKLSKKYTVVKPLSFSTEIINKNSNKWAGVEKIAEKLNIKREEIICVGDSGNDMHMIKNAGLGVAMGNGFSAVKKVADYVTYTNDESGVAHVVEKFILRKKVAVAT